MNVHFVADEANSLGHLDLIGDILAIGRGYGIRLQLYYQDLGQVRPAGRTVPTRPCLPTRRRFSSGSTISPPPSM